MCLLCEIHQAVHLRCVDIFVCMLHVNKKLKKQKNQVQRVDIGKELTLFTLLGLVHFSGPNDQTISKNLKI